MITRRRMLGMMASGAAVAACRRRMATRADSAAMPAVPDHADMVLAAIERVGGLGSVRRGDRVLLKVNTNSGDPYPYSTSPVTVHAITSVLVAAGAHVSVGDRSFWGDDDTKGNLEANGIAAAARAAGADVVGFDDAIDWIEVDPALVPHWRPPVRLPRMAFEAHHVINLACAKTHFITGATLGLKNWLGLVHAKDRARPGNLRTHDPDLIHHQIVDIHRALAPHLTVIDGYRALVGGGPTPQSGSIAFAEPRVVFAGHERVALDVAAIAMLQRYAAAAEAIHATAPDLHPTIVAARAGGIV
jgi:uncharacterized protein (DUF362 family)